MALSFEDSLKNSTATTTEDSGISLMSASAVAESEGSNVVTYASYAIDENWQRHPNYVSYDDFSDDNISTISNNKDINLDSSQFNITQEENSQYIPFEMPRYYDGFDLVDTVISIHYTTKSGRHGATKPVNVFYNNEKIRFGWLVDAGATLDAGTLAFEIHAYGTVTGSDGKPNAYVWKTKSNKSLNVLQSLCDCEEVINNIDDTWLQELVTNIATKVADEIKNVAVGEQVVAAENAAAAAEQSANSAKRYAESASSAATVAVNTALRDYATKVYVDEAVAGVDVSEQLKNYVQTSDLEENYYNKTGSDAKLNATLENYATKREVSDAIANADISAKLNDYYKKTETYNRTEIDEKVANVEVDLSGYATEAYVNNKTDGLTSSVSTNAENISSLGETVAALQNTVNSIDTSPRLTYNAVYNDADDPNSGENKFVLYEIENEGVEGAEVKTPKASFTIVGGSGGGGTSSTLKINYVTTSPLIVTTNDKVIIKYNFSGTDSGGDIVSDGVATWKVNGKVVATNTAVSGENSFDITDYISIGTQKVLLTITDDAGSLATKTWTVQQIDVKIESDFNDTITYPLGEVAFSYKPFGSIDKTIHFKLDGVELPSVETKVSGIPMSYSLPSQTHGSHLVEAYIVAELNNETIESNHIFKDIIWYNASSDVPVIGCVQQNFVAKQYDNTNIKYTVFDPSTETPTVSLAIDGKTVSTLTLDSPTNIWQFKSSDVGSHVLTITCGETVKTINATIEKLDIEVSPVTAGLAFDFNPVGKSNNDADRLWSDGDVSMTVSDNFDWVNGGYQIDENGDQYFCIKSGTNAVINYNLFADDPKRNGKEFKVVFKTTNIKNRNTSFISCMNNNIGLDMKVESANIYSSNNSLYSPYCEEDIIEFEFNINKDTDIPMVLTYEDGVGNRPMIYTSDASFIQTTPQPITIGSVDCDVYIYRMKAYSNSLSDSDILSNFIADARNADEMVSRYNRNQIYDENGLLDPYVLAEKCPDLRVILVDAPWFTNDKSNKVDDTIITMIYKNGDPILDNWVCTGARHSGQGTSSNEYGYSGRNMDLIMDGDSALFTLGDGTTTSKTISLTRDSVPTDYLNVKVNIASSENQNNAQMTMRFNEYQPYKRTARLKDSKIRDCMEFYNCVVFIKERNEDISTHREFTDTNWHYYALGNVGDSKKTDDTRVNDKTDPKECCIEIMDYNVALAEFPTGNSDGSICNPSDWKVGNTAYDYLYAPYKYKDGNFKSFGSESYEFRYEMKGITEEQRQVNIDAWREAYKFVVTSTDEEFYNNFSKYFVLDSILYFYLFTERYTMVDNRAKNCFFHRGKVYYSQVEASEFATTYGVEIDAEYINDEQAAFNDGYRWDLTWGYDFDTALGISNTGKLEITYGKEDTDFYVDGDPTSSYIFRAAGSTFFCRVRDLFNSELQAMFVDRENVNAWSSDGLINQWDKAQSQFPEEIWRLDIQRKYLRTYQGISIDNSIAGTANPRFLTEMLNGRKKYQRRMFERNQELYMATKYFGNKATQDQIMMRFNNPVGATVEQDFTLYLTPYSDMYIGVKFGNVTPTNFRAKAGVEYTIPYGIDADTADITLIYGASFIQAIGDLSKCYVGDNDFSKATRLQSLTVGSDVDGYENTYMTKITLGNNKLLEYLDVKNVTGLNSVIDLSQCSNLLELHAEGSGATGVIFANGGKLQKAYIPSVISLTMKNLNNIEIFDIENYSNLQTLIIENTPFINTYEVVNAANKLNILRLIGMNWNEGYQIEDTSILNRLLTIRGIGNDGYETPVSVLAGNFYSSIVKQKELETYVSTWKDLEITYSTLIEQYAVTFVNDDGTVLEVQYVDKGGDAVDPATRVDNPIVPTKESSVQYDYTFAGWDGNLTKIFSDRTITATYSESLRSYTIKYVSKGTVMQSSTGLYGENVPYTGITPTYTLEESGYVYYLFNRWDKSGFIDGEKTVNAIFDRFEYTESSFSGKELADLSPVEIYAMNKLGLAESIITDKDPYTIVIGNDIDYDDIESKLLISEKTYFGGSNYVDTGIQLLDEDRDFVLAIDYEFLSGNKANAVLAQCFQANGANGFKLWYSNSTDFTGAKFTWGTTSDNVISINNREIIVIRHKKGDNNLTIYKSNLDGEEVLTVNLTRTKSTIGTGTLVFGCARADDGIYENYAIGNINWAKLWYADLGADVCKSLAMWTHESITLEACGFRKYYLTENTSKRCSFSLLASHLLGKTKKWNPSNTNDGGWANSALNKSLNTRLYNAMPTQIKSLLKQVIVYSSVGKQSSELSSSDCYITIPALVEVDPTRTSEPYNSEGTSISYMNTNSSRKRAFDGGDYGEYWLRSPNVDYANYIWRVDTNGQTQGIDNASTKHGVLIEISL